MVISGAWTFLSYGTVLIGRYQNNIPEAGREPQQRGWSYRFMLWIVPSELAVPDVKSVSWADGNSFGSRFHLGDGPWVLISFRGLLQVSILSPENNK